MLLSRGDSARLMPAPRDPPPSAATLNRLQLLYGDAHAKFPRPVTAKASAAAPAILAAIPKAGSSAGLPPHPDAGPISPATRATAPEAVAPPFAAAPAAAPAPDQPPPAAPLPTREYLDRAHAAPPEAAAPPANTPLCLVSDANASARAAKPNDKSEAFRAAVDECNAALKAFRPLKLASLPAPVQQALVWMRERRDEAVKRDASLAPSPEMGHDLRLLRFLIGTKWDTAKAVEEYVAALRQRRDLKVDALRDRMLSANGRFFREGAADLDEIHFHPASAAAAAKMPRLFVRPEGAASGRGGGSGGPHRLLQHKEGHMLVLDYAPDFGRLSAVGEQAWHETELAFGELQMLILDELSRRTG
jgi:hypothetical protein